MKHPASKRAPKPGETSNATSRPCPLTACGEVEQACRVRHSGSHSRVDRRDMAYRDQLRRLLAEAVPGVGGLSLEPKW